MDAAIQIMEKTDEALEEWVNFKKGEDLPGITVLTAFSDDDDEDTSAHKVEMPYLMIASGEAEEDPPDIGNFRVAVAIELHMSAKDTTRTVFRTRGGVVAAMLFRDDVVSGINALDPGVSDYTAFLWTRGTTSRFVEEEEGALVLRFEGEMLCMPS